MSGRHSLCSERRSLSIGTTERDCSALAAAARAETYPVGTTILQQGGEPSSYLYVIRTGHVEIRVDGQLVDMPGVGEIFGELTMVAGSAPTATVRASEEVECLLLDRAAATNVLGTQEGVSFVQASLRRGLSQALDTDGYSLIKAIEQADSETAAIAAARELPTGVCALVGYQITNATKVGRVVGSSIDAFTRRLLGFAVADLGDAPTAWAWLALGSEARLEQALHTDQDHALAYDPGDLTTEELDPYFAQLAERVTSGIETPPGSRAATAMRWPCIRGSVDPSTRGPMRSEAGCQIRAWTGASCRRSRSISGV